MPLHTIRPLPTTWSHGPEWELANPDDTTLAISASLAGLHKHMTKRRIHVARLQIEGTEFVLIPQSTDDKNSHETMQHAKTELVRETLDDDGYPINEQENIK